MVRKTNQGQQTELVKKRLICHIVEKNIPVGGKLPSQAQLRTLLNVGSKTIQRAMKTLEAEGIIELREKSGTFLKKADAGGYRGRKIGLVSMRLPDSPVANILLQGIQLHLHDRGADCVIFLRDDAEMNTFDSMELFPGLERSIKSHAVDALISTVPLDEDAVALCKHHNIPLCYYGDRTCYDNTVSSCSFYPEAIGRLAAEGCRRPAVFLSSQTQYQQVRQELTDALKSFYGEQADEYIFCIDRDDNCIVSRETAEEKINDCLEKYLALPPEKTPDALYIPDDLIVSGIVLRLLLKNRPLPKLITHRNRQIPLGMPFPMIGWYENNIMDIAAKIVESTYELLQNGEKKQFFTIQLPFISNK